MFDANLTQGQVAKLVGVSSQHVSRIVNGRALPSAELTARFAEVVGKRADKLWAEVATYQLAVKMLEQRTDGDE